VKNMARQNLITGIAIVFILLLLWPSVLATEQDEKEITETILEYNYYFAQEEMDGYLDTIVTAHLSPAQLAARKAHIQQLWDTLDTVSFAADPPYEISVDEGVAIATYTLKTTISDGKEQFSYEQRLSAMLFQDDTQWRIFIVLPEKQLQQNLALLALEDADYLTKTVGDEPQDGLEDEPETPTNETVEPSCAPDLTAFKNPTIDLTKIPAASSLVGDEKTIAFTVDEQTFYYLVKEKRLTATEQEADPDYVVTTDGCTIERIKAGADPIAEYDAGNIKVEGGSFTDSMKLGVGKIVFWFYRVFTSTPNQIWVEAENGILQNAGQYSFIGATSRGPGELYLGTGGSSATYIIEAPNEGIYYLYVRVSDDGVHANGARNAIFTINGVELPYTHISKNYVVDGKFWGWEAVGTAQLKKGINTVIVKKPQQTSAAFTMDKFVFSEKEFTPS